MISIKDLLMHLGYITQFISSIYILKAIVFLSDTELRELSAGAIIGSVNSSLFGTKSSLCRSVLKQRIEAWIGIVLLIAGFMLQFIANEINDISWHTCMNEPILVILVGTILLLITVKIHHILYCNKIYNLLTEKKKGIERCGGIKTKEKENLEKDFEFYLNGYLPKDKIEKKFNGIMKNVKILQ